MTPAFGFCISRSTPLRRVARPLVNFVALRRQAKRIEEGHVHSAAIVNQP